MYDQIIIKNLQVKGQLGPDAWLYPKDQILLFNIIGHVKAFVDADEIGDTVSYSSIANYIQSFAENEKNIHSLQKYAAKIAFDCLNVFGLEGVTIKIEKKHSLLEADSTGIEITRTRKDIVFLQNYLLGTTKDSNIRCSALEDFIFISNLLLYCVIGVNDCERVEKQKVVISLKMHYPPADTNPLRNNYRTVAALVKEFIERSLFKTLEKMAIDVCDLVLQNGGTSKVSVYIEKPSALRFAQSSGVMITRSCDSYDPANFSPKPETFSIAYIGIGTNLGNRIERINQALLLLKAKHIKLLDTSFLYETAPMYVLDQPAFLNACLKIETSLSPVDLLVALKEIEQELGRDFGQIRNGPRVIDLDILFYDNLILSTDDLIIPHARIQERLFVLYPLSDIAGQIVHPLLLRNVQELLNLQLVKDKSLCHKVFPIGNDTYWNFDKQTYIMGILNTTPDSFSDGGQAAEFSGAIEKAKRMINDGADIIDIGGQSTAPNAPEISIEEEISRVVPVIKSLRSTYPKLLISVDTFRSAVASAALKAGANYVNDVSGGERDPDMRDLMLREQIAVCLMHMRGNSTTMQSLTNYNGDLMNTLKSELSDSVQKALTMGVYRWNIMIDPGIGFSKTHEQNYEILKRLPDLRDTHLKGMPILIGVSRKGFLGKTTNEPIAANRVMGTAAANAVAVIGGANIIRVHDVKEMKQVSLVLDASFK